MKQRVVFTFGEWRLDPIAKVLFRKGEPVHLTRKAVETLLVLVENAGRVLTKEEIMRAVWTDRVVDEANLAQNIAVVRRVLSAEKGNPAHIETFPGRGYRLEGPVLTESDTPSNANSAVPEPSESRLPAAAPSPLVTDEPLAPSSPSQRFPTLAIVAVLVVAGLGLMFYRSRPQTSTSTSNASESVARVLPITRMPGKEFQPCITADGKRIAFLSAEDASTAPTVWVQESDGSGGRQLSKGGHHSSPAWSRDGTRIAFLRIQRDASEIVITNLSGGPERVVARLRPPAYGYDHRMIDWSPDGRWLVVSRPAADASSLGLYLFDANTGKERVLTEPGGAVSGDLDPRFSPDGKQVSFLRLMHRTQQEIFTISVNGGHPSQVTKLGRRISSHDWMPDGKAIVFASDRGGDFRLWRLRVDANDGGKSATALSVYSEFPIQLSASRAAESLVYSTLQQDRNIWRFNLAEREWKRLIASSGQDASPQYSPLGDRICFRSDRTGEEQLWMSNADGTGTVQITRGSMRPSVGRWSPDGASIVFNTPQTGEVWVASYSGKAWSTRNVGVQGVHPVFSHDGQWIYAGGPSGIVRFAPDGTAVQSIATIKSEALAMSRDGEFLYFVKEPTDTTLWRIELDTASPSQVLDGLVPGCTSCWALAADGIYFLGTDQQSFDRQLLQFKDFKTSAVRTILPYPEPLWPLGSGPFSLGPDSNLLVVRVEPSNTDAMLVTPFR